MKPNETWIIRHKETKEVWTSSSGKSSWNKPGHAKSAWLQSNYYLKSEVGMHNFDDQDEYELVEIKSDWQDKYEALVSYLKVRVGEYDLGYGGCLEDDIEEFIEKQES